MSEKEIDNLLSIKDRLEERGVESVIFDLDTTLVNTEEYYKDWMIGSAQAYLNSENIEYSEEDLAKIYLYGVLIHRQAGGPLPISEYVTGGVERYLSEKGLKDRDSVKEYIQKYLSDFYKYSPEIEEGTLDVLHVVNSLQIPFGIYSHAQYEWTEVKIKKIQYAYLHRYGEEIEIPFFTTPIDKKKDKQGWIQASCTLGFNLRNSLVVGDSMNSDIKPALEAGCRNLVYITTTEQPKKDKLVTRIEHISKLLEYI